MNNDLPIQMLEAETSPEHNIPLAHDRVGRFYVAGPMTGLPEYNFPAFHAAATELRANGLFAVNPAEHGIVDGADWADYMHYDLTKIGSCGGIYLLPGWSQSRGARLEVFIGMTLGMKIECAPGAEAGPMHWIAGVIESFNESVASLGKMEREGAAT